MRRLDLRRWSMELARFRHAYFGAWVLLLAACGDATGPEGVAGSYTATTFTTVQSGNTTNVLTAGGSLSINLTADGATTGQLFVPASVNGGTALNASMAGTFTVTNGIVTFTQSADSFVRDMPFTVSGKTLTGSKVFSGTTVNVVLIRP
jgi:hypothetical protein